MPGGLIDRLRDQGFMPPDYAGRGLVNVPATVLDVVGALDPGDPVPLRDLEPALRDGARQVVVVLVDGLGADTFERLCGRRGLPFLAGIVERARHAHGAQLLWLTSTFPSTTAAAIPTLNSARTPQEHGSLAYYLWLDEFAQVAQMLRWGPAAQRRGSFFDDPAVDLSAFVKVRSIHARIRDRGGRSYVIEPDAFRTEALTRMHASEAEHHGYVLPSTMGVWLGRLLDERPWGGAPAYAYAYWSGVDLASHVYGPESAETAAEAAVLDQSLARAFAGRPPGDTLVLLTADHGHASVDPDQVVDLVNDERLAALLRHPVAGEPRVAFLHTDEPARVLAHLEREWPGAFFFLDRDEAIAAGLFGRGDASLARGRVGEVCALLKGDRAAWIVKVEGQAAFRHRGAHGGMSPAEMRIPLLAWRV